MSAQIDIGQQFAAVKATVKLSDIVGKKVRLVKSGREMVGLCPFHNDSSVGSFSVNDDKALYKCFACGANGDHFTFLVEQGVCPDKMSALRMLKADAGIDFGNAKVREDWKRQREQKEREQIADIARRRKNAAGLFKSSAPGDDTPAQFYLEGRGIDFAHLGRFPGAIRFKADMRHRDLKRPLPAMVCAITGPHGHHATHVTFLERTKNGRWVKLSDETYARICPEVKQKDRLKKQVFGPVEGGSIPLHRGNSEKRLKDCAPGDSVAISEGVEDALSYAMAVPERRCHAAYSLDNMGGLWLPDQIGRVEILCQRDKPGSAAIDALGNAIGRLQERGFEVWTVPPAEGFKDFNDQLLGKRMV